MSLRSYLILMILATVACYLGLAVVINFFDPFTGGLLVLFFFYLSLFLALLGSFSVIGLLFRLLFSQSKLVFKKVTTSFRQAIWFSLLVVIGLFLNGSNLLSGWNVGLLILAFSLLELFFISYKTKSSLKI